jgi:16S rRNA (uracil1498-N3)-methyltransferase
VSGARRFFVEGTHETGAIVDIGGGDAHKIARVLRLHAGDSIEVFDSAAAAFDATIEAIGPVVRARLTAKREDSRDVGGLRLDVAQAVPKGGRMDFVIEKGTELGASAFAPFYCERSVGRAAGEEKLARWRRLARSAAQQSGRRGVPDVLEPVEFASLLTRFERYDVVLFAWELAPDVPLRTRLEEVLPASGRALVVVGPEGGFTHDEAEDAQQHGAILVSLGARILRTDTAAMALLAVIGAFAS